MKPLNRKNFLLEFYRSIKRDYINVIRAKEPEKRMSYAGLRIKHELNKRDFSMLKDLKILETENNTRIKRDCLNEV